MSLSPALQWSLLDSTPYRIVDLTRDLNLDIASNVTVSHYLDILASREQSRLNLFTLNNTSLLSVQLPQETLRIGFNSYSNLIIINSAGNWRLYTDFNGNFTDFKLPISLDAKVIKAQFSPTSDAFLMQLSTGTFIYVKSTTDYKVFNCLSSHHIINWHFNDYLSKVKIVVETDKGKFLIDNDDATKEFKYDSQMTLLSISPNLNLLAIANFNELTIWDLNSLTLIVTHSLKQLPLDIQWCGDDAIAVSYKNIVYIYGPTPNSFIEFYINDSNLIIKTEQNGVYLLSSSSLQYISKVPYNLENVFQIGSSSPSAILLDAIDLLDKRDFQMNNNLSLIQDSISLAIDTCIRAASEEFNPYWQRKLLRAANLGKSTLDLYNSQEFIEVSSNLHILNSLRTNEVGLFFTYFKFQSTGIDKVIDLLINRNFHLLAIKICDELNYPTFKILVHWANSKIKINSTLSDDELFQTLTSKLSKYSINWCQIATFAFIEGRPSLARKLLVKEPNTWSKIDLLLEMNEFNVAITKASEDYDIDCIIFILLELKQQLSLIDFFKLLNENEQSQLIYQLFIAKLFKINELKDFFYQREDYKNLVITQLNNLNVNSNSHESIKEIIMQAKKSGDIKIFLNSLIDYSKTIEMQLKYQPQHPEIIIGEPLVKTLTSLFPKNIPVALKIQSSLKISSLQLSQWFLNSITSRSHESELDALFEFSQTKQGMELPALDYYTRLVQLGFKRQGSLYISRIPDSRAKMKAFITTGLWRDAMNLAVKLNDRDVLVGMIEAKIGDPNIINQHLQ